MERLLLPSLLILVLLSGCASLQAKREVFENTLYSSYPELQVAVTSNFEYIGESKEAETRQYQDGRNDRPGGHGGNSLYAYAVA